MRLIAGDIGGTNTRLIYADVRASEQIILAERSFLNSGHPDFTGILKLFLAETDIETPVDAACFAIAGPVVSDVVSVTNLPWIIRLQQMCDVLQTPHVTLINDFVAAAHGISELDESDIIVLQQGSVPEQEYISHDAVVVGAGTGLGVAHLIWLDDHYKPYSSEAGHVGFAPENSQQSELLLWMQKKHSHVSLEWVLSGKGLMTIYQFLHEVAGLPQSPVIIEAMENADPAQVITESALLEIDDLCQKTLDMFIDIYGAAAGNAALYYYPVCDLYIAGGIAAKIKNRMIDGRFTRCFNNKAAMSAVMQKITIKLILQENVGLYGALSYAHRLYSDDPA